MTAAITSVDTALTTVQAQIKSKFGLRDLRSFWLLYFSFDWLHCLSCPAEQRHFYNYHYYYYYHHIHHYFNINYNLQYRGRKSSAYSHNMRRKIMANVGSRRKIKQNVVSHIQKIEVMFFLLTWIYFLSPLFFWFYFLSSVSQISKISPLTRQVCLAFCESHIVVMLAATILYGSRLTSKLTELNITF